MNIFDPHSAVVADYRTFVRRVLKHGGVSVYPQFR